MIGEVYETTQEAIFETQALAAAFNHPRIEPEHLLLALLQQEDGVVPQIVLSQGRSPAELQGCVEAELQRKPKVYGTATQVGVSASLQRGLQSAQAEAEAMRDDYVSTEHLLLKEEVAAEDIAAIVARWTGIPVSKLHEGEVQKLLHM